MFGDGSYQHDVKHTHGMLQGLVNKEGFDAFCLEVSLLAAIDHKNIVTFVGYSLKPTLLIVMEFVEGGTLSDYLAAQSPLDPPGIQEKMRILIGSAMGFAHLHAIEPLPILHRDIKSENILVTKDLDPRIADLGEARVVAQDRTMTMGEFSVTKGSLSSALSTEIFLSIVSRPRSRNAWLHCS